MGSTIMALFLSGWAASHVSRRHRFVVFCIGTIVMLIPVRYVVYPVGSYLNGMSAQQVFSDFYYVVILCFRSIVQLANGDGGSLYMAIPGILASIGLVTLITRLARGTIERTKMEN